MSGWDATIKCFALLGYLIGGYQAVTLAWSVEGWLGVITALAFVHAVINTVEGLASTIRSR